MKNTIFPAADNYHIPRALYIAAWKVWFKRFDEHHSWREGAMPAASSDKKLHQLIESRQRFSLEVVNRLIVPWSYRDDSQVNQAFFLMNQDMLKRLDGEQGDKVRLTDQALDFWDVLTYLEQDLYTSYAEARIQADIETPSREPVIIDDAGLELIGEDIYPPVVPQKDATDLEFAKAMVAWIDDDPFTPMYQRLPIGEAVSSWHDRLKAFFWPKPRNGLMQVSHSANPVLYRAGVLGRSIQQGTAWQHQDKVMAVKTAEEIFLQAGMPQRGVTWENVYQVIKAAVVNDTNSSAKMNSGWSLLASFATYWLDKDETAKQQNRIPLISLNSRIATSLISRLDFILVESGYQQLDGRFAEIGTIPGVGGTRPRELSLSWPDGYRSWKSLIAASRFVNLMVDCLNNEKNADGSTKYRPMPSINGGTLPWDVQGVQLVLFSDGY